MSLPPTASERARHLDADHAWRKHAEPQLDRLERTLRLLPESVGSLLDVGVGEGDWLRMLARSRPALRLGALDLSPQRLADLDVPRPDGAAVEKHEGDVTDMPLPDGAFDAVSLLEVVEHVPEWTAAVDEALRVARCGALVTVPYREQLQTTVCVHCHRATPLWGHLHSFDESSFDRFSDRARVSWRRIPQRPDPKHGRLRFVYRTLRPVTPWIGFWLERR
jgi:ubiquinone/menaquinone biosynthesis C-methylase UbiE